MRKILFSIGPLHVYGYGFMIAIGIVAAFMVAMKRADKKGLDENVVFSIGVWGLLGGIIGAKLLFYITELKSIIADPSLLLDFSNGFVVYGGIIGGILFAYIYCRVKKIPFLKYFDLVMPSIALAQGFGRIGCFLAGCCYGRECDAWYGIAFQNSDLAPNGVKLIPTQLISSAANFISFFILLWIAKKAVKDGQVAALYLILYSVGRFLIEFLRNDPRGAVGALSTSQFISIFTLIGGIALFCVFTNKKKEPGE